MHEPFLSSNPVTGMLSFALWLKLPRSGTTTELASHQVINSDATNDKHPLYPPPWHETQPADTKSRKASRARRSHSMWIESFPCFSWAFFSLVALSPADDHWREGLRETTQVADLCDVVC